MTQVHVIVKYFIPVTAGIEVNTRETYSKLVDRWNITFHTSTDTLTEKNVLPKTDNVRGINVERYEYKRFGFWPNINWDTADFVALHNFNVFPHFFIMGYTFLLKLFGKKKFTLLLTPHGGFNPEWSIFPLHIRLVKKFYHYTIGTLMINLSVDGVRAVSEWEGKEIIAKGVNKKKVEVITNGIEDEAYQDSEQDASPGIKKQVESYGRYIIQIGRVYVIKNYETVIRALPKLPKDIKYLIVGPVENNYHDSYKPGLEKLASELGVSDRVLFLGVIKGVDKYYLIKHAQLMVHMALWESFCNVVHEGMSQGLPCIVSNVYALPYLIKDGVNGYCLPVKDSDAVADKINYVLENMESATINNMRKVNKEFGLKNSWTNVAESMFSFYSKQRGLDNE